jgi:nitrite reductase/ring-hydroxylating ferredoxin subunit/uncharacterized membrane protein
MEETTLETTLEKIPAFDQAAQTVSRGLHQKVLEGGEPARKIADALHGTWLGHPLHPALTDFVVGAWGLGSILSLVPGDNGNGERERVSDQLIKIGIALSVPTAVTGMTDFSTISRSAMKTGMSHGLLNTAALLCYSLSLRDRARGNRHRGNTYSTIGFGLMMASAWLGGTLTYKHRIGVNKLPRPEGPEDWKDLMALEDLPDKQPRRVDVDGSEVLVFKSGGEVMAISAVCSHEEGPLEEGKIEGRHVQCPWHQSVFDMRHGRVVHGPSTYPQHRYQTRTVDGRLQIRLAE